MNDYAIEVRGLTKRYGQRTAVEELSFVVPRGSIVGAAGPERGGEIDDSASDRRPAPAPRAETA